MVLAIVERLSEGALDATQPSQSCGVVAMLSGHEDGGLDASVRGAEVSGRGALRAVRQ